MKCTWRLENLIFSFMLTTSFGACAFIMISCFFNSFSMDLIFSLMPSTSCFPSVNSLLNFSNWSIWWDSSAEIMNISFMCRSKQKSFPTKNSPQIVYNIVNLFYGNRVKGEHLKRAGYLFTLGVFILNYLW